MSAFPGFRSYPEYPYVSYSPHLDSATLLEMQASYLKFLANMCSDSTPVMDTSPPSKVHQRSAYSQVNMQQKPKVLKSESVQSYDSPILSLETAVRSVPGSTTRPSIVEENAQVLFRRSLDDGLKVIEEKPIHGVNKKFEEFLEEQLEKDKSELCSPQSTKQHDFLKRRSQSVPFQLRQQPKAGPRESESLLTPSIPKSTLRKHLSASSSKAALVQETVPPREEYEKIQQENQNLWKENARLRAKIKELEADNHELRATLEQSDKDFEEWKQVRLEQMRIASEKALVDSSETGSDPPQSPVIRLISAAEPDVSSSRVEVEGLVNVPEEVKEIQLKSGGRKLIYPDGRTTVYFKNNDIKDVFPDGKIMYQFAQTNTVQTTFPDGLQIFKFSNGQLEKHFPDKHKEINFPDGTVKKINASGQEETIFPDGTVQRIDESGVKHIDYVNGQKETVLEDGTRIREFPDGSVKTLAPKK